MIRRRWLLGLAVGSLMLVAGCPLNGLGGLGPLDYAIPDGAYSGKLSMTASFWQNGVDDGQDFDSWGTTKTFKTGDLINKVTGDWFYPGDQDTLDFGSLQLAGEVTDVEQFDWGYHCAVRRHGKLVRGAAIGDTARRLHPRKQWDRLGGGHNRAGFAEPI